jgi:hypothetical protein
VSLSLLWTVLGVVAGGAQASALWHVARRRCASTAATAWRLPAVVAILAGAALAGRLLPAASGWAGGLLVAVTLILLRSGR